MKQGTHAVLKRFHTRMFFFLTIILPQGKVSLSALRFSILYYTMILQRISISLSGSL